MDLDYNNGEYENDFEEACSSGETSHLSRLIAESKFQVNKSMCHYAIRPPLIVAIEERSLSVAILLLNHGADLNVKDGWPLSRAVYNRDVDMVRLLLDRGADVTLNCVERIRTAIEFAEPGCTEAIEILEILLKRLSRLSDDLNSSEEQLNLGKYSQLCLAVLQSKATRVSQLLAPDDYSAYAEIVDSYSKPSHLAARFGSPDVIEVFVRTNTDVEDIFWEAVRRGSMEILEMCAACPEFDVRSRNNWDENALYDACRSNQFEVIKLLVNKYGLDLEAPDWRGYAPIVWVNEPDLLRNLLAAFPEIVLNLRPNGANIMLHSNFENCELFAVLLEHGTQPGLGFHHQHRCSNCNCKVIQYMQKLLLIDPEYVINTSRKALSIEFQELQDLDIQYEEEYISEVGRMQSLRISQSTSYAPGKTLFDFMFLGANAAARFSRNEIVLQLYKEAVEDFRKSFPQYGFVLNYRLRRGKIRRHLLETAEELLCSAFGVNGVPENFVELIFGYFSNNDLKRFGPKSTID